MLGRCSFFSLDAGSSMVGASSPSASVLAAAVLLSVLGRRQVLADDGDGGWGGGRQETRISNRQAKKFLVWGEIDFSAQQCPHVSYTLVTDQDHTVRECYGPSNVSV